MFMASSSVALAATLCIVAPSAADRDPLLEGVASIASAGVPGPLVVVGEEARVLVAGRAGDALLPVVAAAEWERGRVVVFGHGGMIARDALRNEGTRRLVANAAAWLRGERAGAIGVVRNDPMVAALRDAGFAAEALTGRWTERLDGLSAVVADAHGFGEGERLALAEFVTGGGGLMTAGLGWGWLQLNPARTIREHPGTLLLADAGILFADGTLETTAAEGFTVGELPEELRADVALERLEGAGADGARFSTHASRTLLAAFTTISPEHPLFRRGESMLAERTDRPLPTPERPLRRPDAAARALVALEVEVDRVRPASKVAAHPTAAHFPGAVPDDAPRVTRRLTIDRAISGWHSTGLYAPAGAIVRATASEGAAALTLQIGCHTDHLWHLDRWQRIPDIVRRWSLVDAAQGVASPFGGLVYIDVPRRGSGTVEVEIAGVVESPRFVLGRTTPEEWRRLRADAKAPWGELETSKVIVSVPSEALRSLEDPTELLRFWDAISDTHATLATIPLDPERPHRFVPDVQISAGYMHAGYPIMTHLDAVEDMTNVERLRAGSWGLLHELGHNHQEPEWTFDGTVEVTVNLFSLYAIDTICRPEPGSRGHPAVDQPPSVAAHFAAGSPFEAWKRDPFLALQMYIQLERAFGWDAFKRVFAEYRALPRDERPRGELEKRDQWMTRFSRAVGRNLGPFFERWGVPTSEAARASIAELPLWLPDWEGSGFEPG